MQYAYCAAFQKFLPRSTNHHWPLLSPPKVEPEANCERWSVMEVSPGGETYRHTART